MAHTSSLGVKPHSEQISLRPSRCHPSRTASLSHVAPASPPGFAAAALPGSSLEVSHLRKEDEEGGADIAGTGRSGVYHDSVTSDAYTPTVLHASGFLLGNQI